VATLVQSRTIGALAGRMLEHSMAEEVLVADTSESQASKPR
jgi:hypothetical protein